jgi:hypothetical protein
MNNKHINFIFIATFPCFLFVLLTTNNSLTSLWIFISSVSWTNEWVSERFLRSLQSLLNQFGCWFNPHSHTPAFVITLPHTQTHFEPIIDKIYLITLGLFSLTLWLSIAFVNNCDWIWRESFRIAVMESWCVIMVIYTILKLSRVVCVCCFHLNGSSSARFLFLVPIWPNRTDCIDCTFKYLS